MATSFTHQTISVPQIVGPRTQIPRMTQLLPFQPHTCTLQNTAGWNGNHTSEILNAFSLFFTLIQAYRLKIDHDIYCQFIAALRPT